MTDTGTQEGSQLGRYLYEQQRRRRAIRRTFVRLFAILIVTLVCMIIHATVIGLPDRVIDPILERLNSGSLYVEAEKFKLDLTEGIVASNPRMYRKKRIGPPFIEAEELTIETDLRAWLSGGNPIEGIRISRGTFRRDKRDPDAPRTYADSPYGGRLTLDRCDVEGLWVKRLTCRYRNDGPTLEVHDIIGTIGRDDKAGSLKGSLIRQDDQNILKGHLEGSFDPSILEPVLTSRNMNGVLKVVKRFDFEKLNPDMVIDFTLDNGPSPQLRLSGHIDAEHCRYNDVYMDSLETSLSIYLSSRLSSLTVHPLLITRRDGMIEGGFTRDFNQSNTTFNIISSCAPEATLGLINPEWPGILENIRVLGRVNAHAHGIIYTDIPDMNDYQVAVTAQNLGYKQYMTDECRFDIRGEGLTTSLNNLKGSIYGGNLSGRVEFTRSIVNNETRYTTELDLRDLNLKQVGPVVTGKRSSSYAGKLNLNTRYTGLAGTNQTASITGEGRIHIKDTPAFQLPVIGDLSDLIAKTIPGLDFLNSQGDIKGDFIIGDNRIQTDKLIVEGNVLSLQARGSYNFDKEYDVRVRAKLLKPHTFVGKSLNLIFLPVSQILEFRLDGKAESRSWTPVILPRELTGQKEKDN